MRKDCPIKLWRFWIHHDDLTKINVILKGSRIVIPPLLQLDILQCILEGPFWEEKCKWRAQKVLFWPQMNKNIKVMWQKCKTCSKYAPSKPKELMILHEVPTYPWQKLGTDLFKPIKVTWLLQIIIHYGQMFICLHASKQTFAQHGLHQIISFDNGPPFSSRVFQDFAKVWEVTLQTSSSYHPQSNGLADQTSQRESTS